MKRLLIIGLSVLTIFFILPHATAKTTYSPSGQGKRFFVLSPEGNYLAKVFHSTNSTWVRIHETGQLKVLTQWQIPDFKAHTVRFSAKDPGKLLLADNQRLLVYRLIDDKQKLMFLQPKIKGQEIVQAYFDRNNDEIVWATKSVVYRSKEDKKNQKELARIPWERGNIKHATNIGPQKTAVVLENSNKVLLVDDPESTDPIELTGHQQNIVGLHAIDNKRLISVDDDYKMIIWNTESKQQERRIQLEKPGDDAKLLGFSVSDSGENVQTLSKVQHEAIGQRYSVRDLEKGVVKSESIPMTMTSAGNVYSSATAQLDLEQAEESSSERDVPMPPVPKAPKKKKNTLYSLAAIEAENGNYQAALDLIKKIGLDDPEYGKSRQLKSKVFEAINVQNTVNAAKEQMAKGNYSSARVILENAHSNSPNSELVNRYLKQIDEKDSDQSILKIGLITSILVLLAVLAGLLWYYRLKFVTPNRPSKPGKVFGFGGVKRPKPDEEQDLRRQFVYKLDATRKLLNKAATTDSERRYKNTWMEMTARLNTMEKRAKISDRNLPEFLEELEKLQKRIEKITNIGSQKADYTKQENADSQKKEEEKKEKHTDEKSKEKEPPKTEKPNYHQILGVRKNASFEEIKQAYRRKMKEYHPDRHNASEFSWVKEEADKRTRLVQEAYNRLSEQFRS